MRGDTNKTAFEYWCAACVVANNINNHIRAATTGVYRDCASCADLDCHIVWYNLPCRVVQIRGSGAQCSIRIDGHKSGSKRRDNSYVQGDSTCRLWNSCRPTSDSEVSCPGNTGTLSCFARINKTLRCEANKTSGSYWGGAFKISEDINNDIRTPTTRINRDLVRGTNLHIHPVRYYLTGRVIQVRCSGA